MSWSPYLAAERDLNTGVGRVKDNAAARPYMVPGHAETAAGAVALTINTDYYGRVFLDRPAIVDQFAFEVTTLGAGNARCGLYRADYDWQPIGAPLADSGDISVASNAVKTYTPGTPIYLERGRYLTVINSNVAVTLRVIRGPFRSSMIDAGMGSTPLWSRMSVGRTYAAFPTPGSTWAGATTGISAGEDELVLLRLLAG